MNNQRTTRQQRKRRISRSVRGTGEKPRLSVFRSNATFYSQIIDDTKGKTLVSIAGKRGEGTKTENAKELGKRLAAKAKEKKISTVVFDKGLYKYHGRVKAFADGAREGGLKF